MPTLETPYSILNEIVRDVLAKSGRSTSAEIQLMPFDPRVLGFVKTGQNVIYVNTIPLKSIGSDKVREYLYVVILHEYFHLLGIADEREVRRMTVEMVSEKFGEDSYAHRLSMSLADPRDVTLINSWKHGKPLSYM
ncbi:MAG: hypothetical protein QW699_00485 [Metallosphaera sp.]